MSEIVLLLKVKNIAFWDKFWWKVYSYILNIFNIFKNPCFQNKCDKIKSIFNDIKNCNNNEYYNALNLSLIYDNRDMFFFKVNNCTELRSTRL